MHSLLSFFVLCGCQWNSSSIMSMLFYFYKNIFFVISEKSSKIVLNTKDNLSFGAAVMMDISYIYFKKGSVFYSKYIDSTAMLCHQLLKYSIVLIWHPAGVWSKVSRIPRRPLGQVKEDHLEQWCRPSRCPRQAFGGC